MVFLSVKKCQVFNVRSMCSVKQLLPLEIKVEERK